MRRLALLLGCTLAFTLPIGPAVGSADLGKVARFWDRQMHTGGQMQLLDYSILRCGPRACVVKWHERLFIPGDEQDFAGFNEYVGQDLCYVDTRVACQTRRLTVHWVKGSP